MTPVPESGSHRKGHVLSAVHQQKFLAYRILIRAEKLPCRRIDAQHGLVLIQHHQTFPHVGGDLLKFIRLAL